MRDIAKHLHCHPDFLSRKFKQYVDIDLSNYILKARIERAKELLKNQGILECYISQARQRHEFSPAHDLKNSEIFMIKLHPQKTAFLPHRGIEGRTNVRLSHMNSFAPLLVAGFVVFASGNLFVRAQEANGGAAATSGQTNASEPRMVDVGLGWAKSSINTVKFRHASLATYQDTQFIAYYDANQKVVVGKRKLSEDTWELKTTELTGNTRDAHNTISIAVDGEGYLHMSWNHHNEKLHYVISKEPLSLELIPAITDGVAETKVTYPEFYNMPNGDLLLMFRDGMSGDGVVVLKRYDVKTKTWKTLHENLIENHDTTLQISGTNAGKLDTYNAYCEMCVDAKGTLHLGWVWRSTGDVKTNHNVCYAQSTDGGISWTTAAGKPQELPINALNCETALVVPTSHGLINQTSIAADADGHPYICTFFKPVKNPVTQLMVVHFDGNVWKSSQVGERLTELNLGGIGTKRLLLSRPLILIDDSQKQAKVNVIFRDVDRGDKITVASTANIDQEPWTFKDLTLDAYGSWEPTGDDSLWRRDKTINLFVQNTNQLDSNDNMGTRIDPNPTMVRVLEWKP